jgi:beta-galactosidase/beta-glucuronidase
VLIRAGKTIDEVSSYTAMRKISTKRDANGIVRMQLNNKDYFHYGPLDQGWWPDGLYTAPTDEALLFDIKKTKDFGFNMIRKHVKVEPARWYYHCDREGILVWQDMPSGDLGNQWAPRQYGGGTDKNRSPESIANYYREWQEIMDLLISNPSVVVWVPFNEGWGQFDTEKVAAWTAGRDPSRLVNPASGGNHRVCGDMMDLHNYPAPEMYLFDPKRVNVLGEYGGIGLPLEGHLWWDKRNWGYVQFKDKREVTDQYIKYAKELKEMVKRGFSAAVYTQTTDVEGEVNGLMTYDRKEIKLIESEVKAANQEVINQLGGGD